jgi:hypothetical protein
MGMIKQVYNSSGQDVKNEATMTKTKQQIDTLWCDFREAIDRAYKAAGPNDDGVCLRDFAQDVSWHDDLAKLLGQETANERQHRGERRASFSVGQAAKLILMSQATFGASLPEMPKASLFLVARQTAAMAEVIGWIARKELSNKWREAVKSFDYAKLMKESEIA